MTSLISEEYIRLNAELHRARPDYGAHGGKWAEHVKNLVHHYKAGSVLDYGCGKQALAEQLRLPFVRSYDPALPGLDLPPDPADLVVCTDVLEHVEPDSLSAVLTDLAGLTRKAGFLVVATRPAAKTLPDGRNAHLIQRPAEWWLVNAIMPHFTLKSYERLSAGEFMCVVEPA